MSDMLLKDCKTGLSKANEEIRESHLQEEKEKLKPVYDISEKLSNVSCDVSNIKSNVSSINEEIEQLKRHIKILSDKNKILEEKNKKAEKRKLFYLGLNDLVVAVISAILGALLSKILS